MKTRLSSLLVALFATISVSAKTITEGMCGNNLRWSYDSVSHSLIITGSGYMEGYHANHGDMMFYEYAPWYGYDIHSISLPDELESIGSGAFSGCSSLTTITIPTNVTLIGLDAFSKCTSLDSVVWNAKDCYNHSYEWGEGSPFHSSLKSIVFGNDVKTIPCALCMGIKELTSVIIPDKASKIDDNAFNGCSKLVSIIIPDSVTHIGASAFANCSNLESLCIGKGIAKIDENAFASCDKLETVIINAETPPSNSTYGTFSGCGSLKAIHIPCGTKEDYLGMMWHVRPLVEPDPKWTIHISSENRGKGYVAIIDTITCRNYKSSFSATANYGYHFTQWSDGNTDNPRSVEVTQDTTFTAEFAINGYSVTTTANDAARGSTTGDTIADYLSYAIITATPCYGYQFSSWSDGNTDNPRTIQITRDSVFTAIFYKNTYSVTLLSSDSIKGTVLGPNQSEYLSNIAIEAQPNYGYHFTQWSDGNTDNPRSVEVTQDTIFTAEFAPNKYSVSTSVDVFMGGGATIGDTMADYMSSVTITAVQHKGYHFIGWSDGNTDNPRTIQVTQDIHLTAFFGQYSIYTSVNNPDWGYTLGDTILDNTGVVTITAVPNYGYHFVYWEEGYINVTEWEPCCGFVSRIPPCESSTDNPRSLYIEGQTSTTAIFVKNTYSITVQSADYSQGSARASSSQAEYLDEVTLNAYPDYGYHFAQWSDGNTDNPRTLVLTQDTIFTAQFAPNQYSISTASSDTVRGSTSGDTIAYYGDHVPLTAIANYGYRFDHWTGGWGFSTENPFIVQVSGDATYTAVFEKNTFSVTALPANDVQGSVDAPYNAEYLDQVTLQAQPNFGYQFSQWSDGNTDNPRTFVLTQDTTFTAEFALIYSGQCGENLYWSYADHTLSITGTGDMYDYGTWGDYLAPWALFRDTIETISLEQGITYIGNAAFYAVGQLTDIELPNSLTSIGMVAFANCSKLTKIEIPYGVTSTGTQAFANCSKLGSVSLPSTLTTIGEGAFTECRKLFNVYSYATEPPKAENNSFANFNVYLHVPCDNLEAYQTDMVFGSFKYIQCIGAENTDANDDVTVTPADNNAVFVWPADGSAASYTLEIRKDGEVFCTLVFNANGQLSNIAFAPSRGRQQPPRAAEQTGNGFRFTVTGLTQATHYKFDMVVKDANDETLHNYTGEFTTGTPTSVSTLEPQGDAANDTIVRKVFRNGQVYILRNGKIYTTTGVEVK